MHPSRASHLYSPIAPDARMPFARLTRTTPVVVHQLWQMKGQRAENHRHWRLIYIVCHFPFLDPNLYKRFRCHISIHPTPMTPVSLFARLTRLTAIVIHQMRKDDEWRDSKRQVDVSTGWRVDNSSKIIDVGASFPLFACVLETIAWQIR